MPLPVFTIPTNKNIAVLDRKEWQMMTPPPTGATAGIFVVAPPSYLTTASGIGSNTTSVLGSNYPTMYVTSATQVYLYYPEQDGWAQIPSPALAGSFGGGSTGTFSPWSITYTATGGSTTQVQVSAASYNLSAAVIGKTIEFLSVSNVGVRRIITGIDANAGAGTIVLTLDSALGTAVTTNTFRVSSGRYFVMNGGTVAAGSWKVFDLGTYTWQASLATTGLPSSWGTDARAVSTARHAQVLYNGSAASGSTTTLVDSTANWGANQWAGSYVLTVSGTGAGQCIKILSNTATTLTFAAVTTAPAASTVYQIRALGALSVGVATGGSATTLVNSAKAWVTNAWTNFQVRIISGTGAGQKSKISSNTATTLTIASGATIDTTSVYEIEPLEDSIYLLGNSVVTMYLYSISGNSWSTVAPTTARAAAPGSGMGGDFVAATNDPLWASETATLGVQEGRYIYSFRANGTSAVDRFDIAGGTSGAGAWTAVTYPSATETFTGGSSIVYSGRYLYLRKEATNRFFRYDIPGNELVAFNTDLYPDGQGQQGVKMWVRSLDGSEQLSWLYSLGNTSAILRRVGIV